MNRVKNILRFHAEWILIATGVLFAAAIGWFLAWGVAVLAKDLGASLAAPKAQYAGEKFNLDEASKLNFRGLK